jgi:uridine kinase
MREDLLRLLSDLISRVERAHPVRVAIDGVDAAGKTTLGDELVAPIEKLGRPVIRASVDGFHLPAGVRYRRGKLSAEGYYRDSFNHAALIEVLLEPLGPNGNRLYRRSGFDSRTDSPVDEPLEQAPDNAVLLFDGVFLLGDSLRPFWDYSIFVKASFETTVARAEARDGYLFGSADEVRKRYEQRYVPGQRMYLSEVSPERRASIVVINDDPSRPSVDTVSGVSRA